MQWQLPVRRDKIQTCKTSASRKVHYLRIEMWHWPGLFNSSGIDWTKVNGHPVLRPRPGFGDDKRRSLPSGGGHYDSEVHFQEFVGILFHEHALLRRVAACFDSNRIAVRLESYPHRFNIGWSGFAQPYSKTEWYFSNRLDNLSHPASDIPFARAC